jgi:acetyl/propionyl-CoA carboxylase alpha subunit
MFDSSMAEAHRMTSFRRLLIANRGEIAVRILRTCRAMGIETVAVYSEFDAGALHVRLADLAVPIGPPAARDSYLNIPAILQAGRLSGADAIHPGYGFLAENADFAAACENAGLVFVGPRSSVIRAMGSKIGGRTLAQEAGVPVALSGSDQDIAKLGFPVLIKASAGGGGRGMRIVRDPGELQDALEASRGEAARAFGDDALLVEKYIEDSRHIEIQIFGDHHGNLMHLFERDCSVQRRYQKVIEESPSPAVTPDLRERMAGAALALAKKIGYTNAGTVEFLLAPSGEFYFIEVNTRIQVEHPVTEMVTGLDLVRLQIEIAQGRPLPAGPPRQNGHAIEARLYAEDPENDFLPSTGTLHVWRPPSALEDVRVDSGVDEGTEIGVHYDPLLAKVIAHAPDRETAIHKLSFALRNFVAQGAVTNREFLLDVLDNHDFRSGRAHTGFRLPARVKEKSEEEDRICATIVAAYVEHNEHVQRRVLPSIPVRFHNNPYSSPAIKLEIRGREFQARAAGPEARVLGFRTNEVEVLVGGVRHCFRVHRHGDEYYVHSALMQRKVTRLPRFPRRAGSHSQESANSPMPGQVLRILVNEGQTVKPGDSLIALEAMKMEQTIKAAAAGVVKAILVKAGDMVAPGQMLVEIQSTEDSHEHSHSSAANP